MRQPSGALSATQGKRETFGKVERRLRVLEVGRKHLEGRVFALYTGERWVEPNDGSPPWVTREK